VSSRTRATAKKRRRKAKRLAAGHPQPLPGNGVRPEKTLAVPRPPSEAPPTGPKGGTKASRKRKPQNRRRGVSPRARHMNGIDFLTYVVSSNGPCFRFAIILITSAILVAAISLGFAVAASHARFGAATLINSPGVTVGLTSAGTVAITAIAWIARRRHRRQGKKNR
jgi:hypothetical protein